MNNYNCKNGCSYVPLCIYKIDSVSGTGVPGAVFELTACNGFTRRGTTNSNGLLIFRVFPCTSYMLREVAPPAGYAPIDRIYNICVDACCCIFVDGTPTSQLIIRNTPISASFTAIKVNIENGEPLVSAVYTLFMNSSEIASTVSNAAGQVTFTGLSPGTYVLVETTPPAGFQMNTESLTVVVTQDGSVTINGKPANGFLLNDVPLSEFIFRKLDSVTGLPLAGATFVLTQNGTVIDTVVSNASGLVNFGTLSTGTYQLIETIAPPGFQPNSTVYQVVVGMNGSITVNGVPLDEFMVEDMPIEVSSPPTINTITEGAPGITGTGVPGAAITVTLPNGSTVSTTVNSSGTWLVNVPAGVELVAGDIVSAIQTEPGKLPSIQVSVTVVPQVEPFLEKTVENLTNPGGAVTPGKLLQFTVLIGNLGGAGSVWTNAVLTDFIDKNVTFISDTVAIDGQLIPVGTGVGQYTFDSTTRSLTIRVGDIASGVIKAVTFQVTVNLDAAGEEIVNDVIAGSEPLMAAVSPAIIVEG